MAESTQCRHLVLMFDGTWNERRSFTNVARMFEAVDDYKPAEGDKDDDPDAKPLQLVRYLDGVGTKYFERFVGVLGYGLSDIIKEGYRWLSNNYKVGDKIFVFGFSRGAYSARSLVSLVHLCGGVLKEGAPDIAMNNLVLKEAYNLYRGYVPESLDARANVASKEKLKEFGDNHCQHVSIKMLGVWDTVGALGIPDSALNNMLLKPLIKGLDYIFRWSRKHYVFHNQELPCIVKYAYHALAIDEFRAPYAPTLWDKKWHGNKKMEQVWFVGSHCNVGGGVWNLRVDTSNDGEDPDDLWQYSYIWMQNKAIEHGLRFYWTYSPAKVVDKRKPDMSLKLVPAKSGKFKSERKRISKTGVEQSYDRWFHGLYAMLIQRRPFLRQICGSKEASLHWSVKAKLKRDDLYQPESLMAPGSDPSKLMYYYSEIPHETLPEEICSCNSASLDQTDAASNGLPAKKHS